jgi:hypothetical protein
MRTENKSAEQKLMEDDHGGEDPYRVEGPVKENKKITQNLVRVNNTTFPNTLKKSVIGFIIFKTVLFTLLCNTSR